MGKRCKYCQSRTGLDICPYCKEKMEIIRRIKAMLGGKNK